MNFKIFRTNFNIILFISFIFISSLICSFTVSGTLISTDQIHNDIYVCKYHFSNTMIRATEKGNYNNSEQLLSNINSKLLQTNVFDEEMYKKLLITFFDNSILFAAFFTIKISQYNVLKNFRRVLFEHPYYKHILKLMKYIHKMDGERGLTSLNYSF